ncbi:hypothetical protein GOBAR_AA17707 [Gossypium barbadense]|uniref:SWIM-type domain-containing protein n=1 Tax=Gossypium barbadense TaxID=3634 RepID=A0A2P5XI26_GOSBA|nr:hypothetical protein GOBAR_AA17707 [Gossypium barbadense]
MFGGSMENTTPAQHLVNGWDIHIGHYETSTRRDDVFPTTSIGEGTSYVADDGGLDDKSDVDSHREPGPYGAEVVLFFESEPVPSESEDIKGGSDEEEEDSRFRAYLPPPHMHNVDISAEDALEFSDLPHRTKFSIKYSFLGALKQQSINHGVNYNVVKSKSEKFEAKCVVQDGTYSWKIMASFRKKAGLWEIKKYKGPHTSVAVSQDYPKMDSGMIASLILPMLKEDPRTSMLCIITSIRSQLRTCDCGTFDAFRYPCAHAIAACQNLRLDLIRYVDQVYKIEYMYNIWRHVFPPILDEQVFASLTVEVFKSHKAMGNSNKMYSPMVPRVIPPATIAYISSVELESSALLMGPCCHPFSLDLNGPIVPFRYGFTDASILLIANMACHRS